MSFGFPRAVPEISDALAHAYSHHVLMFAAASNCGGNDEPSWPSRHENVMRIHAATGDSNKWHKSPTASPDKSNFAFLGSSVEARWLPDENGNAQRLHKSGTSTATPIAAGIAAAVITIMRCNKNEYLRNLRSRSDRTDPVVMQRYDYNMERLHKPAGMGAVFKLMVHGKRDGYDIVTPWKLLHNTNHQLSTMVENILAALANT